MVMAAAKATEEATARGIASLMCDHGPDVEWQICTLWEAAYGLLPLNSCAAKLPDLVVAAPLQPPPLSWNLFRPLLRVLEFLPQGSASEACLLRIFTATVEAILHRAAPTEEQHEKRQGTRRNSPSGVGRFGHTASTELRAMVHALFTETCPSAGLAARLLSVAFTVYLSHDAIQQGIRKSKSLHCNTEYEGKVGSGTVRMDKPIEKERGAVSTFDSYVVAAVCALACEVQLLALPATLLPKPNTGVLNTRDLGGSNGLQNGVASGMNNAWRLLSLLEALLALVPQSDNVIPGIRSRSSGEIVAAAVVAAHISEVLGNSRACMHALSAIMRCPLEPKLSSKAASVLALVEGNRKVVAAAVDTVGASHVLENIRIEASTTSTGSTSVALGSNVPREASVSGVNAYRTLQICNSCCSDGPTPYSVHVTLEPSREKGLVNLPINASDVVSLLCMERENGSVDNVGSFMTTVLQENKDLSVAAVPLLCKKLISAPEVPASGEGTSAKRGWRQVKLAILSYSFLPLPTY
jgi:GIGANTEA protein